MVGETMIKAQWSMGVPQSHPPHQIPPR